MKKAGKITSEVMTLTPEKAKQIKADSKTENYRRLSQARVDRYARDIARDQWTLTGEPIIFNGDGSLLNGQHRIEAVIQANKPIETVVVYGVSDSVNIDTGHARSFGDVIRKFGIKNATKVASAVRWIWRYENNDMDYRMPPSAQDLLTCWEKYRHVLEKLVPDVTTSEARALLPVSVHLAILFLCYKKSVHDAEDFFGQLHSGEKLKPNSPALVLRRYLIKQRTSSWHQRTRPVIWFAITIKAWNAYRNGEPVQSLSWRYSGPSAEDFPEII